MTPMRLIQNFHGLRATVISPVLPEALQSGLTRLGLLVEHVSETAGVLPEQRDPLAEADVLIIDGDPGIPPGLMTQLVRFAVIGVFSTLAYLAIFVLGMGVALWLRSRAIERYRGIGRFARDEEAEAMA